jgi:ferredoxin
MRSTDPTGSPYTVPSERFAGDTFRRHDGKDEGGPSMTYTIAEPCIDVKDRACVDECPVDCIYEGPRMLYIQPDECVDCAACEPVCPVTAIFYEDDVPPEWKQFTPINAEFFSDAVSGLGAPGGAASVGVVAVDHPVVAGWATV